MRIPSIPYQAPSQAHARTRRVLDIALHLLVGIALLATAALLVACGTPRDMAPLLANQPRANAAGNGLVPAPPGGGIYYDRNSYSDKDQFAQRPAGAQDTRTR